MCRPDLAGALRDFLETPARQASVLDQVAHRPWPVPPGSWVQAQTWDDLLFAHWRVSEQQVRAAVPSQLQVDTFEGSAWLGITPFRVGGLRVRGLPPVPGVSSFLELNVRTYVTYEDKPGIWFFSLDAGSALAVEGARRTYRLPYFRARMAARREGDWISYRSARAEGEARPFVWEARYRPTGPAAPALAGTREHFLAERYCLYTIDGEDRLARAEIHHPPWPLQPAEVEIELNTMAPTAVELPDDEPLLHFAARQDVVIWPLEPVAGGRGGYY
ncbi:MAG: DUF2071 domain-containing protein [Thermoleophilia bacterium]|nr:DUF2071 domain-containing protein [Thermoleophilia bacterium]